MGSSLAVEETLIPSIIFCNLYKVISLNTKEGIEGATIKERNLRKLNKPAAATGLEPEEETEDSYEEKVRSGVIQCKIATDVESTDSRLARMEERLANIEELLTKALGENPANENL